MTASSKGEATIATGSSTSAICCTKETPSSIAATPMRLPVGLNDALSPRIAWRSFAVTVKPATIQSDSGKTSPAASVLGAPRSTTRTSGPSPSPSTVSSSRSLLAITAVPSERISMP